MFVLRSTCLQALHHVYAQIYMPMCSLPCLYLDLCFFRSLVMPMLRYLHLCASCHVFVLRSICWLLCHVLLQHFCPLVSLFLVFWSLLVGCRSRSRGLDLHPHTQAYIKVFGSFPYMHVYVCLLLYFLSMFAYLDLGLAMLSAHVGLFLCGYIHPPCGLFGFDHL